MGVDSVTSAHSDGYRRIFVLGGVRSGKSRFALRTARELAGDGPVRFIATAVRHPGDSSLARRIERHRAERPPHWVTVEEPLDLPAALGRPGGEQVAVVDCLTLWLSNILMECGDADAPEFSERARSECSRRAQELVGVLDRPQPRHVILIANEVGSGVAPPTVLGNVFADVQGETNQLVAAHAAEVYHLVAGIAQRIK
jgi:adenosylcobinamide kinase/adenosylcobinamide-phosphate guanylyltransferase